MGRGDAAYRFGRFELHPQVRRLLCDRQLVVIPDPVFDVLVCLVAGAPHVISKEAIGRAGWGAVVSDTSTEKAISCLRHELNGGTGEDCIETVKKRGYRFVAAVEEVRPQGEPLPASLNPAVFEPFVAGRRLLATLNRQAIAEARRAFERILAAMPEYAPAHVGLSTVYALLFEGSRFDPACHVDLATRAVAHGRAGASLDPASADAWSTLAFALYINGEANAAAVAAWRAVSLERAGWRHWLRLSFVSRGEERVEAAQQALTLRPRLALACWLTATVFAARGAFDAALRQLRDGCAAQDQQADDEAAYPAVGLHLLRGLVLAAQDRLDEALAAFEIELSQADAGQIYWQECAANTWYARGAVRLRQRQHADADAAFRRALEIAPRHVFSLAALGCPIPEVPAADLRAADVGIARAIALARGNRHAEAAQAYAATLADAAKPNAGWTLPVEPILCPAARPDVWGSVLARVARRAT